MKALVLGAAGQLGSDLVRLLPDAIGLTREQLSIADLEGLREAVGKHRPDVVFNCAAYNAGCMASERVAPLRSWREGLRDWARGQITA